MQNHTSCILCGSPAIETVKEYHFEKPSGKEYWENKEFYKRRLWILFNKIIPDSGKYQFNLVHCKKCDFVFLNPRLSDQDIRVKYETLHVLNSTSAEYSQHPIYFINERAQRIHELVGTYVGRIQPGKRILDYGGQFGHNLSRFDGSQFEKHIVDYEKYDLYDDLIYKGHDIDVIDDESYKIILANHIFEHLNYPKGILTSLVKKLEWDGILYIEVPCGVFKEAYNIHEPITHLNYFSELSIYHLLESAGLSVIHLDTRYQWITVDKEWCINIIGKKKRKIDHQLVRTPHSMAQTKHEMKKYFPIIAEKSRLVLSRREFR